MGKLHDTWKAEKDKIKSADKEWTKKLVMQESYGKELDQVESDLANTLKAIKDTVDKTDRLLTQVKKVIGVEDTYAKALGTGVDKLKLITESDKKALLKTMNAINSVIFQMLNQASAQVKAVSTGLESAGKEAQKTIA